MLAVRIYDVVLSIHIMAVVLAFGVTFAEPILFTFVARRHPRALPALHEAQVRIYRFLVTPAATLVLAAGIYLATDRHYWSKSWVSVPMAILIVILGLVGAFFTPQHRRAAELTARDVARATEGEVAFGADYTALIKRVALVGTVASLLVLVAIFFMTAKPGG